MYKHISIYIYLSPLSLSLSVYIYIYIYMCAHVYTVHFYLLLASGRYLFCLQLLGKQGASIWLFL